VAPWSEPLVVTGVGLATSLGGAAQAGTAARAGLARPAPLTGVTVFDEDLGANTEPTAHAASGITDGFAGAGRAIRLVLAAWDDLERSRGWMAPPSPPPFLLAVPCSYYLRQAVAQEAAGDTTRFQEHAAGIHLDQLDLAQRLSAALETHAHLSPAPPGPRGPPEGVSSVLILETAAALLAQGYSDCVLAVAVESLADPVTLASIQALGLLHTAEAPTGFMPGEAAAILALEHQRSAERRHARILGTISEPQLVSEETHRLSESPPLGKALTRAIERALTRAVLPPVSMMGSLNGDEWRAREWGMALTRLPRAVAELPLFFPARALGELGTAFPLVAAALSLHALKRHPQPGSGGIGVWAGGDDGVKAAFVVGPAPAR
jgi:3-oxoacyl-(acyl-carrier-protein) synthase